MKNLSARRDELAHSRALSLKQKYNDHAIDVYTNAKRSYIKGFDACFKELKPEINALMKALEFYAAFATKENHQFIFDNEIESRARIYERYKEFSIGDVGVKAHEALTKFKHFMGDGE